MKIVFNKIAWHERIAMVVYCPRSSPIIVCESSTGAGKEVLIMEGFPSQSGTESSDGRPRQKIVVNQNRFRKPSSRSKNVLWLTVSRCSFSVTSQNSSSIQERRKEETKAG